MASEFFLFFLLFFLFFFYFFPWRWASFLTRLSLFFCIVAVQNISSIFYQFSNLFCYLFVDVLSIFWIQIFCWRQNCKYFVLCCSLPFHTCDSMFLLAEVLNFNVFKYFKPVWPFWYVILNLWILQFWTLWERARVGWSERTASKPICYQVWNRSSAQVGCMRQVLGAGALGRPRGMGWGGRWEGGLGWGTHANPWLIHVNVWQKPLQYCKVISLQLIKINEKINK